ncbi:MAG: DNA polymerase III subunit delta [Deltaproteobacteria bacterium]|nr:MAG: DNA polymerase III subunit delta [Deltaproteobacteria bacterium]
MSLRELQNIIQAGSLPSLILLYGQESYFIDEGLQAIRNAVVRPEDRDFNLTQFQGRDFKPIDVVEQARTFPIFSERRLVIVKNVHEASADQLEGLLSYLEDPVPETVLLLTAEKIDARRKFFQLLKKTGKVIEFKKIYENQLPSFVRDLAKSFNVTLTGGALKLFCKRVGTNLVEVQGELEKLVGYLGDRDLAEESDVAAIVSDTRIESVFDLTDALGRGDSSTALILLDRLLAEGQAPLMVLAMMTRHFRQMWKISELTAQKVPQNELPRRVGASPYFLKGLMQQASRFESRHYRYVFSQFLATDLALKSSGGEPKMHLEQLVLEIAALGKN